MKKIEESTARLLELVFIFLGVTLRTAGPAIQKLARDRDVFAFEWRWLGSAVAAFFATWFVILSLIPPGFNDISRLILAFGIAYAGNGIVNDYVMKWGPLQRYLEKGETPDETVG